jgi:hypothetical protein
MRQAAPSARQIVHDLNNRLTVLHGALYLLAAQVPEASAARPYVERASEALTSAQELISALVRTVLPAPAPRALRAAVGSSTARTANE